MADLLQKTLETLTEKMDGFNKSLYDAQKKIEEKQEQIKKQEVADPITVEEMKKLNARADTLEEKYAAAIQEQNAKLTAMYETVREIMEQKRLQGPVREDGYKLNYIPHLVRGLAHGDWGHKAEFKNIQKMLRYAGDGPDRGKALIDETGSSGGAYLIPEEWSREMIPLLYNKTIFGKLPVIRYNPQDGTVRFPKMTGGCTAYVVGAASAITASNPTITQVNMHPHKIGVLCPVDNALVRRADPMVEQILRNDMVTAAALKAESQYITGTGQTVYLAGLENTASIQEVSMGTDGGKFSASNGFDNLMRLPRAIEMANGVFEAWAMNARSKWDLREVKDAEDRYIITLAQNAGDPPSLLGYPYHITNEISNTQTQGQKSDCSSIYGGQWSNVIICIWTNMETLASKEGSYVVGQTTYHCLQEDTTAFRLIFETDILFRASTTIGRIKGIRANDAT